MDHFLLKIKSVIKGIKYILLVVILYVACEVTVVTINGGRGKWWIFGIYYAIDIFFFFFNCYFIYPIAYNSRKSIYKPVFLIICSIGFYFGISIFLNVSATAGLKNFWNNVNHTVLVNFGYRVFLLSSLAAIPFGVITYIRMLKREKVLENNLLYSRISPHLIFNALNTIHADLKEISPNGARMVTYLSEYSRYAMMELAEDGKANLEAELSQLEILKNIHELRTGPLNLLVEIALSKPVYDYRIPPHLILTLAENLFKYGKNPDPEKPMLIEVLDDRKLLNIRMFNWKVYNSQVISHKVGLDNLRKRLQNIYADFFSMRIKEDSTTFEIHITIPI